MSSGEFARCVRGRRPSGAFKLPRQSNDDRRCFRLCLQSLHLFSWRQSGSRILWFIGFTRCYFSELLFGLVSNVSGFLAASYLRFELCMQSFAEAERQLKHAFIRCEDKDISG